MKPYKPSNKVPSSGFTWLILSSILGGLAIGGITFVVSRLIYLVILFPALMGGAGAKVSEIAIKRGKVRNPFIASIFAALTGIVLYGTFHGAEYFWFKQEASQAISQELGDVEDGEIQQIIEEYLQEETGATGFWGYMKLSAKGGVSIGRAGRDRFTLTGTMTWIYWLIEFGIIEGVIIATAVSHAKQPFCESSDRWYGDSKPIGNVKNSLSENFLNLVNSENFIRAGELIDPLAPIYSPSIEVYLQGTDDSTNSGDFMLTLNLAGLNSGGEVNMKKVLQGEITHRQQLQLQKSLKERFFADSQTSAEDYKQFFLAQLERSTLSEKDSFQPHGLNAVEEAKFVEQLSSFNQLKEVYLVRKVVERFRDRPLYVLGFIYRRPFYETVKFLAEIRHNLATKLELPGDILPVPLNLSNNAGLTKVVQQIAGTPIYRR